MGPEAGLGAWVTYQPALTEAAARIVIGGNMRFQSLGEPSTEVHSLDAPFHRQNAVVLTGQARSLSFPTIRHAGFSTGINL